jgi:hypothetical protein
VLFIISRFSLNGFDLSVAYIGQLIRRSRFPIGGDL